MVLGVGNDDLKGIYVERFRIDNDLVIKILLINVYCSSNLSE